ncbi:hypothetical protein GR183_19825 [Stappia sp. GBMRC 2046]|uniref:Uncharacterized protein n=1 Tax=Stappia sediminis TaxID=2692190 RepID=A0A7X3LXX4_9HYPH|nr:hypothetical protein [Stappia sediminis]MXN67164.1 hypothetical protein [Stappia sediminis]
MRVDRRKADTASGLARSFPVAVPCQNRGEGTGLHRRHGRFGGGVR